MSSTDPFDEIRQIWKDSDNKLKNLLLKQNHTEFRKEMDNNSVATYEATLKAYLLCGEAWSRHYRAKYELTNMKERNDETSKIVAQEALVASLKKHLIN